jgi:hypothetical protein
VVCSLAVAGSPVLQLLFWSPAELELIGVFAHIIDVQPLGNTRRFFQV